MYQQQSGVGGGMLKRHFTMIYNQLDELREQMARMESNVADLALRMQEINRQYSAFEGSRNQISETEKTSQDLEAAVESLKRDINSLRARFESELLSIGDPINSREKTSSSAPTMTPVSSLPPVRAPQPQPEPEQEPETPKPAEIPTPQPEETPAPVSPAPEEEVEQPKEQAESDSSSDKTYSPSVKSLEEQLGLVPPSDEGSSEQTDEKQEKPEEKKKRRFF
jgi:prefoldin subunit 5